MRIALEPPKTSSEVWSMDFVSDSFFNSRRFRVLTIVDDFSKESPLLLADTSISGQRVARALDEIGLTRVRIPRQNDRRFRRKLTPHSERNRHLIPT